MFYTQVNFVPFIYFLFRGTEYVDNWNQMEVNMEMSSIPHCNFCGIAFLGYNTSVINNDCPEICPSPNEHTNSPRIMQLAMLRVCLDITYELNIVKNLLYYQ